MRPMASTTNVTTGLHSINRRWRAASSRPGPELTARVYDRPVAAGEIAPLPPVGREEVGPAVEDGQHLVARRRRQAEHDLGDADGGEVVELPGIGERAEG